MNKNNLCDTCQGNVILDRQDINEIENAKYSRAQFDEHTYSEIDKELFRESSVEISENEIVNRIDIVFGIGELCSFIIWCVG